MNQYGDIFGIGVVLHILPEELYTLVDCHIFNFFVFSFTKYVNKSSTPLNELLSI